MEICSNDSDFDTNVWELNLLLNLQCLRISSCTLNIVEGFIHHKYTFLTHLICVMCLHFAKLKYLVGFIY